MNECVCVCVCVCVCLSVCLFCEIIKRTPNLHSVNLILYSGSPQREIDRRVKEQPGRVMVWSAFATSIPTCVVEDMIVGEGADISMVSGSLTEVMLIYSLFLFDVGLLIVSRQMLLPWAATTILFYAKALYLQ